MHQIKRWCISNFLVILTLFYFDFFSVQRLKLNELRIAIFHSDGLQNLIPEIVIPSPFYWSLNHKDDNVSYPPETFLSTPEIIRLHGYQVEEHKVITSAGYIISIFRILASKTNQNKLKGTKGKLLEPVLIQHGFICSSDDFLQLNPKDILPYLLSNSGHNVWLGNFRGNTYGKEHVDNISSSDPKFYDFTMDDTARDLPDVIRYVLKVEKAAQLNYVCHSMGCLFLSMAVHDDPKLNSRIKKASFLAPGHYFQHLSSTALSILAAMPEYVLSSYSQILAGGRIIPVDFKNYAPGICVREKTPDFCDKVVSFLGGLNPGQITNETLVKVFGHFPADTSMKLYIHVRQCANSGNLHKYDYGPEKNMEFYGSTQPPLYNLSRTVFPVQGIYGLNDNITPPKDVLRTWSELGNVLEINQVADEKWTHLDFLYGKNARKLVYEKIVQFLD